MMQELSGGEYAPLARDSGLLGDYQNDFKNLSTKDLSEMVLKRITHLRPNERLQFAAYIKNSRRLWMKRLQVPVDLFTHWYSRSIASDLTASQRRLLKNAGVSTKTIKDRWTIKVGRTYISPTAAIRLGESVEAATNLITRIMDADMERIQEAALRGFEEGGAYSKLERVLLESKSLHGDLGRIQRVANDQANKISYAIQAGNMNDVGITRGVWIHHPGTYSSRSTHQKMHGKEFDLSLGLWDEKVNKYVLPAELPFCRCKFRPVLPEGLIEDDD